MANWDFKDKPRNVKELDDAMWGRSRSVKRGKSSWKTHGGGKRCPNCRGESDRWSGKGFCYASACGRGPNGRTCDCHGVISENRRNALTADHDARQSFGVRRL